MIRNEKNGVVYYTFESFERTGLVTHCFSTKLGGVSAGIYEAMNLGLNRGDSRQNVMENYRRLGEAVGFEAERLVLSDQVHDVQLRAVGEADCGKGIIRESDIRNIDGLMTKDGNVVLTTFYADCVPLYFLDTRKKVIALSHAGWRGTLNEIGALTVMKMAADFGCETKDIIVGIGPSISRGNFEVGTEVSEEFENKLSFSREFIYNSESSSGKRYIDLWEINKASLVNAGILAEHIEISGLCTVANSDIFYSHRKVGKNRGSLAAFMALRFA